MATASFINPSPKTIENSFGYSCGLMMVRAATASDAQIVAENFTINDISNLMCSLKSDHPRINPKITYDDTKLIDKVSQSKHNPKTNKSTKNSIKSNIEEILEEFFLFQIVSTCKYHGRQKGIEEYLLTERIFR